jgi:subfamily B ATP-binding cassette protein MsbA
VIVLGVKTYYSIPWTVVFISLFLWPIVAYLVVRIGRRVRALGKAVQEKVGELSTTIHESISGIRILKAFSMEPKELEKFSRENREVYRISMKSIKRTEMVGPLVEFIGIACAVLVLWFGGRGIVMGEIDAGAFLVFLGALLSMLKPFKKLSRIHLINQQAASVMVRIFEILDKEPTVTEKKDAGRLPLIGKSISFNNVKFRYDTDDILEDINLEVRPGDIIAIVGHTGAGKTTLLNLLPRFYDPTEGSIMIDGHDIKDVTLKSLRDQIGIVTQEPILFHDTVLANVSYGKPNASQDEVIDACKAAYCHDFIVQMEKGYDTYIGERGVRLSGGEKQRLAIARAILKNPPILILDEATSQLDSESEKLVQDAIDKLMHGRTVFIIAHRLSTIRNATKIVILAKGRINGIGTHEELLENNELYRRLYEKQFR